jgi:hypothetical protein
MKLKVARRRGRHVRLERRLELTLQAMVAVGYDWGTLSGLCLGFMGVPRQVYAKAPTPSKEADPR